MKAYRDGDDEKFNEFIEYVKSQGEVKDVDDSSGIDIIMFIEVQDKDVA